MSINRILFMKYNNEKLNTVSPYIFTKKVNNKHKVIPLNLTINTSGPVRHFPPATKEWFNSIYTFNSNNMKNLSIADKTLSSLLKSYFNFYFNNKIIKSKRIATRFRRLDVKTKIFISKAEVKHTSSKVIITLFIYNEEKRNLNDNIKKLTSKIFPSNFILHYKKKVFKSKISQSYIGLIGDWLYSYKQVTVLNWFTNTISSYFNELVLEREEFININKKKKRSQAHLKKTNILNRENLLKGMEKWINFSTLVLKDFFKNKKILKNYDSLDDTYFIYLYWLYMGKRYKVIKHYKTLLRLNNAKFKDFFVKRLNPLISSIYKKEVQLNIINLKTLYLNSDIFTQVIALKLKNRDNRLLRVLRSALYLVKLPKVNVIKERFDNTIIKDLWNNKVNNFKVNLLLNNPTLYKSTKNRDTLNVVLYRIFSNASFNSNKTVSMSTQRSILDNKSSLLDHILTNLKNKNMAGVRLEAKGRLTRRFTASRSVFKLKWKGGIRNIDSSYRGLSAVMLRGHLTSNVQYTQRNSKTRIGAFGLKGWVSSK